MKLTLFLRCFCTAMQFLNHNFTDCVFCLNCLFQKTIIAVLDCMIDPVSPSGDVCVYYNVLDADNNGRVPTDSMFNSQSKSGLQIIAKSGNKASLFVILDVFGKHIKGIRT